MSWGEYFIILACVTVTMVVCRVVPLFALKGRSLPEPVERALNLIPPAAFGALVANDLFTPGMFDAGFWPAALPLIAAVLTLIVGYWRKSLVLCIMVGCVSFGLMMLI